MTKILHTFHTITEANGQLYSKIEKMFASLPHGQDCISKDAKGYTIHKVGLLWLEGQIHFVLPRCQRNLVEKAQQTHDSNTKSLMFQHIRMLRKYHHDCKQGIRKRKSSEAYLHYIGDSSNRDMEHNPLHYLEVAYELWHDYEINGLWLHSENTRTTEHIGTIDWQRSLHFGMPLVSKGQILFREIHRNRNSRSRTHPLTELHLYTLAEIAQNIFQTNIQYSYRDFGEQEIRQVLHMYDTKLFQDRSVKIHRWLCEYYLKEGRPRWEQQSQNFGWVVRHCYLWEWMLGSVLGLEVIGASEEIFSSQYSVSGDSLRIWNKNLRSNLDKRHFIPDIWYNCFYKDNTIQGIIDAKDYDIVEGHLPGSESISKQIVYKYALLSWIQSTNTEQTCKNSTVFNIFAFPLEIDAKFHVEAIHRLQYDIDHISTIMYVCCNYEWVVQAYLQNKQEVQVLLDLQQQYRVSTMA